MRGWTARSTWWRHRRRWARAPARGPVDRVPGGRTRRHRAPARAPGPANRVTGPVHRITLEPVDIDRFIRDGYVAVRGVFDPDTAATCREMICDRLAALGVTRNQATWTRPDVRIDRPEGG